MQQRDRNRKGFVPLAVAVAALLAGACGDDVVGDAPAPPPVSFDTTTSSVIPTVAPVTEAPPLSIPSPSCTVEVTPRAAPVGTQVTATVRSNLPNTEVTILVRLPSGTQTRKARTDGTGVAQQTLPAVRAAAGRSVPLEVTIPLGPARCGGSYQVT